MPEYFKEISLKEWGCYDMVNLDFVIHIDRADRIVVIIRDTREKIKHTHILDIYSEAEKEALVKGFRFLADTLEKSDFLK